MDNKIMAFIGSVLIGLLLIGGGFYIYPKYKVYAMEQNGKAQLAQAEQTKKIMIETARAEKEAAILRAEAIEIMGEVAKKYPEYRNQEFITAFGEALKEGKIEQIIYVPTEANIPLLEAGKR